MPEVFDELADDDLDELEALGAAEDAELIVGAAPAVAGPEEIDA